jgi:hypothetical protein
MAPGSELPNQPPLKILRVTGWQNTPMAEGRRGYQRSTSGLIGAMIVLVLCTLGFVFFRNTFRADLEIKPEPVDYLAAAKAAQVSEPDLIYPASLPEDWIATSVTFSPGERQEWKVGALTDEGKFAGLVAGELSLDEILQVYVDEETTKDAEITIPSQVANTWQTYRDQDGDTAYVATRPDQLVMVYGSAEPEELQELIGVLTQKPLTG